MRHVLLSASAPRPSRSRGAPDARSARRHAVGSAVFPRHCHRGAVGRDDHRPAGGPAHRAGHDRRRSGSAGPQRDSRLRRVPDAAARLVGINFTRQRELLRLIFIPIGRGLLPRRIRSVLLRADRAQRSVLHRDGRGSLGNVGAVRGPRRRGHGGGQLRHLDVHRRSWMSALTRCISRPTRASRAFNDFLTSSAGTASTGRALDAACHVANQPWSDDALHRLAVFLPCPWIKRASSSWATTTSCSTCPGSHAAAATEIRFRRGHRPRGSNASGKASSPGWRRWSPSRVPPAIRTCCRSSCFIAASRDRRRADGGRQRRSTATATTVAMSNVHADSSATTPLRRRPEDEGRRVADAGGHERDQWPTAFPLVSDPNGGCRPGRGCCRDTCVLETRIDFVRAGLACDKPASAPIDVPQSRLDPRHRGRLREDNSPGDLVDVDGSLGFATGLVPVDQGCGRTGVGSPGCESEVVASLRDASFRCGTSAPLWSAATRRRFPFFPSRRKRENKSGDKSPHPKETIRPAAA